MDKAGEVWGIDDAGDSQGGLQGGGICLREQQAIVVVTLLLKAL